MNLTQTLRSTVNAEVSSVTNFNPPCAGIFLPAIRNKRINSQRIAPPIPGQRRDVSAVALTGWGLMATTVVSLNLVRWAML